MRWLAVLALAGCAGCAGYHSTYRRTRVDSRELVWAYHDRFQVTRDGKVLAEQGDWDGLPSALACVPVARIEGERAAERDGAGRTYFWTGNAVMIASVVAATAIIAANPHDADHVAIGFGGVGAGIVVGLPLVQWGIDARARADMTAIDAVNIFNDERATCRQAPTPP